MGCEGREWERKERERKGDKIVGGWGVYRREKLMDEGIV